MSLDEAKIRATVQAKMADKQADMAIRRLQRGWWQPLLPTLLSASLAIGLLVIVVRLPAAPRENALLGVILFLGIAYNCFLCYRQNVTARALAHKLQRMQERLDQVAAT